MSDNNIEEKYKKLFGYVNLVDSPKGLETRILSFIEAKEKRLAKIKAWVFGSTSVASFGFTLWAGIYLVKNIKETGLWQYLSLAFSENGAIFAYWKEFSLSLAESLPVVSIILFLTTIGVFIWSITKINYKKYEYRF